MNIGTITQKGLLLQSSISEIPAQHSANFIIGISKDTLFHNYTYFCGLSFFNGSKYVETVIPLENDQVKIPEAVFSYNGQILLSLVMKKDDIVLVTHPIYLTVVNAPMASSAEVPPGDSIFNVIEGLFINFLENNQALTTQIDEALQIAIPPKIEEIATPKITELVNQQVEPKINEAIEDAIQNNSLMDKTTYDSDSDGVVDRSKVAETAINAQKVNNFTVARNVEIDEYTNEEIDQKLVSSMKYKGSLAKYSDLASVSGKRVGWVYNILETGVNYAWTGSEWDPLGSNIDLTDYYNKSQVDNLLSQKANDDRVTALENSLNSPIINYTIPVNAWVENIAEIPVVGATSTSNHEILPGVLTRPTPTQEELANNEAFGKAGLQDAGQETGKLYVYAKTAPTTPLNIRIVNRGVK